VRGWIIVFALVCMPTVGAQNSQPLPEPQELPSCGFGKPTLFAHLPHGIENLAFDGHGSLFLTTFAGRLYRAWPNGTFHVVYQETSRPAANGPNDPSSLMGIDFASDGSLFVSQGLAITGDAQGRVLRFPVPGEPTFEVYAKGFEGVNGLAVAPDGDVFVVHGFRNQVWRITDQDRWTLWAQVTGANGVVLSPDGKRLVFSQVTDAASRIVSLSLTDPADRRTEFFFNKGPSEEDPKAFDPTRPIHLKGVDDLEVLADGRIFGSAHLRGQVVMGDPSQNRACIAMEGLKPDPTSVRLALGFGDWDGRLFSTDSSGDIWALDVGVGPAPAERDAATTSPTGSSEPAPGLPLFAGLVFLAGVVAWRRKRGGRRG
jgi:sugar lactone lactonase YvrE